MSKKLFLESPFRERNKKKGDKKEEKKSLKKNKCEPREEEPSERSLKIHFLSCYEKFSARIFQEDFFYGGKIHFARINLSLSLRQRHICEKIMCTWPKKVCLSTVGMSKSVLNWLVQCVQCAFFEWSSSLSLPTCFLLLHHTNHRVSVTLTKIAKKKDSNSNSNDCRTSESRRHTQSQHKSAN